MKQFTSSLMMFIFCISAQFSVAATATSNLAEQTNRVEKAPIWKQKIVEKFEKTLQKPKEKKSPANILSKSPKFFLIGWLIGWAAYLLFVIIAVATVTPALAWLAYFCLLFGSICATIWLLKRFKIIS